jgi:DNA replication and repair protein RecF
MRKLDAIGDITIEYRRGWDRELGLSEVLARNEGLDIRYGSTQNGPHRADIVVKHDGIFAVDVLSRGQQKMLVGAMKMAQGSFQSAEDGRQCLFLIDDLPAELDEVNRQKVCAFLESLGNQVFMTCVDETTIENTWKSTALITKFHVEHGKISP